MSPPNRRATRRPRPSRPRLQRSKGSEPMPKMKTHRGAAQRFRITRNGKVLHRKATGNHMLTKKSGSQRRRVEGMARGVTAGIQEHQATAREGLEPWRVSSVPSMRRRSVARSSRRPRGTRAPAASGIAPPKSRSCTPAMYAFRDRRDRKAQFRRLWITRINAACRPHGHLLLAVHQRAEGRGHRGRPQDPRRHGGARPEGVRKPGRQGQGRAGRGLSACATPARAARRLRTSAVRAPEGPWC